MRLAFLLWIALAVLPAQAGSYRDNGNSPRNAGPLSVMTQNLYIGTDILDLAGEDTVCGLLRAAGDALEQVEANDFSQRVEAIAALVIEESPHVLGVQEAITLSLANIFGIEYEFIDYLGMLEDALDGQYYLVETRSSAELEVGANTMGSCDEDNALSSVDVRATVTDQDAFLCRSDVVCEPGGAVNFEFNTMIPTPAGDVVIERGWVGVIAEVKGHIYQVLNTHLEVGSNALLSTVQYLQSMELVGFLNELKPNGLPQIVLGDFNSDEFAGFPVCEALEFCLPSYQVMLDAGFIDTWNLRMVQPPGYTCCQEADLRNEESVLYERIDQVWVRGPAGRQGGAIVRGVQTEIVGDDPSERSVPDGLWPSDHAGLVTRMWISRFK